MLKASDTLRETLADLREHAATMPDPHVKEAIAPTMDLEENSRRVARVAERGARRGQMSPAEWKIIFDEMRQSEARVEQIRELLKSFKKRADGTL